MMVEICPTPDALRSNSERAAMRLAQRRERAGAPTKVEQCGDHFHIVGDPFRILRPARRRPWRRP